MRALQTYRPETAEPLNQLANILLQGPGTLSPGERELIGTFVSSRNDCFYCQTIHGAVAAHHLGGDEGLVAAARQDPEHAPLTEKMKALLAIAGQVQLGGKYVTAKAVAGPTRVSPYAGRRTAPRRMGQRPGPRVQIDGALREGRSRVPA